MNLDAALDTLAIDPQASFDVAELALHLARDEYPDLDVEAYLAEMDGLAHEAQSFMRGAFDARVMGLCRYLFHEMGFHGNTRAYFDPANSYLNLVLDRRTGIPISLSAVLIGVGARTGLDIRGIGLPGHFVVKAVDNGHHVVIDPFHGGRLLTPTDCEHLVLQVTGQTFTATPDTLGALPLGQMVARMLNNLKGIYLRQGDLARSIRVMERLRQLRPDDVTQRRDLGKSLLEAGLPGKAIDHLAAYVGATPGGVDSAEVERLLRQARSQISAWN